MAVVVFVEPQSMAALYDFPLPADLLFRLACLVLIQRGDNGSMGDLACIAYEGLVSYRSFDRRALADQLQDQDLDQVLALIGDMKSGLFPLSCPILF